MIVELFLAGLGGVLIATVAQIWFQRIRLKADVMLAVVGWADEVYRRTIDLQMQKKAIYSGEHRWLTEEQHDQNNLELRNKLLSSDVIARLALVYGEGDELGLLNDLKKELLEVIDANGKKVGNVIHVDNNVPEVRIVIQVDGHIITPRVNPDGFHREISIGGNVNNVLYDDIDCDGNPFLPPHFLSSEPMLPYFSISDPGSTVFLADGSPQNITVMSRRDRRDGFCETPLDFTQDAIPATALIDLDDIFIPPFTLR